jgi:hypothetical protein
MHFTAGQPGFQPGVSDVRAEGVSEELRIRRVGKHALKFRGAAADIWRTDAVTIMIGYLRQWTLRGGSFGIALGVLANPGYLPRIGPAPLRMLVWSPPGTNAIHRAEPPAPKPPQPQPQSAATTPQKTETPAAPAAPPPVPKAIAATNAPLPRSTAERVISPQDFLKYFNSVKTNGNSPPLDFSPPQPGGPVGSTSGSSTAPP